MRTETSWFHFRVKQPGKNSFWCKIPSSWSLPLDYPWTSSILLLTLSIPVGSEKCRTKKQHEPAGEILVFIAMWSKEGSLACTNVLFDLILYVPSTIFQLYRDESSWVEPVLS